MTNWQDDNGIPVNNRGAYDAADIDWQILDSLPTLSEGYTANLKIETGSQRVWLERTTTADGEHCDHHVTVETNFGRGWITTSEN